MNTSYKRFYIHFSVPRLVIRTEVGRIHFSLYMCTREHTRIGQRSCYRCRLNPVVPFSDPSLRPPLNSDISHKSKYTWFKKSFTYVIERKFKIEIKISLLLQCTCFSTFHVLPCTILQKEGRDRGRWVKGRISVDYPWERRREKSLSGT